MKTRGTIPTHYVKVMGRYDTKEKRQPEMVGTKRTLYTTERYGVHLQMCRILYFLVLGLTHTLELKLAITKGDL